MKKSLDLMFNFVLLLGFFALVQIPTHAQSWHIAIEQNPMQTSSGTQTNIPVGAAHSCPQAINAALAVWNSAIKNCVQARCPPNTTITAGTPSCTVDNYTRPNGSAATRYQVDIQYKCVTATPASCSFITPDAGMPTMPYWKRGTTVTIKWNITGFTGPVRLQLIDYCSWTTYSSIVASTPNTGTYSWNIPVTVACGIYEVYVQNVGTAVGCCYSANIAITKYCF